MRAVVATFPARGMAEAAVARLRDALALPYEAVSLAKIVAAHEEPYDGHHLLAAWVPDEAEPIAMDLVVAEGGALHREPV